jgi:hypothetical protein
MVQNKKSNEEKQEKQWVKNEKSDGRNEKSDRARIEKATEQEKKKRRSKN